MLASTPQRFGGAAPFLRVWAVRRYAGAGHMQLRAVIFDLGGVVLESPIDHFRVHEARSGLPPHFISRLVVATGESGAWARLERGELDMHAFYAAFEAEALAAGARLSAERLMVEIAEVSVIRPDVLDAVRRVRARGLKAAALTNNWPSDDAQSTRTLKLKPEFDVFVESCRVGMRKPEARIYEHACRELGVDASEAVFLDDIGANLKPARAMGMVTIKVSDAAAAIAELERALA